MAAYAAVVSLIHVIEQIQILQARIPIFLENQLRELESLREKVTSFQDFLECFLNGDGNNETGSLEGRIRDAAYSAEDILESHILKCIRRKFKVKKLSSIGFNKLKSYYFSKSLHKAMEKMDFITEEAKRIKQGTLLRNCGIGRHKDLEDPKDLSYVVGSSSRRSQTENDTTIPIHDDILNQIMDKLTGQPSSYQVVLITGMGGIGKTTLAKSVYNHKYVVNYFDIRSCVMVTQTYSAPELFLGILDEFGVFTHPSEREKLDYHHLGEKLHKHLTGRRYLILIDDVWSVEAWEQIKHFVPDTKGSGIVVTTRLSTLAKTIGCSCVYEMSLLDDDSSWLLLSGIVFGQEKCPTELENIGRKIAMNCKGLPLSITVIGGLLVRSELKRQYWEHVSTQINPTVNLDNKERCLKILSLSYYNLPVHLRPCFLYMGIFPEDVEVRVSELIRLWVAEGFLKPKKCMSLEEVARSYLDDLVERNLIIVSAVGYRGNIKCCRIHDLLRDFCLRECQKEKFLYIPSKQMNSSSREIHIPRRIGFVPWNDGPHPSILTSHVRSLIGFRRGYFPNFVLLRIFSSLNDTHLGNFSHLLNLRYIDGVCAIPSSSINLLWNVHTICLRGVKSFLYRDCLPVEIWNMSQLKHLKIPWIQLSYPEVKEDEKNVIVLGNLQTLENIIDFTCTGDVLKRIPNIKKLAIFYQDERALLRSFHNNLDSFKQLQSLKCCFAANILDPRHEFEFPLMLRKLTLYCEYGVRFYSEEITEKVGRLPHLEKLTLRSCYIGKEWNPIEGQFPKLKYLEINSVRTLHVWNADSIHFPNLEQLHLTDMPNLEEIPPGIGDIETLRSIQLYRCNSSTVASAKEIIEEQRRCGNVYICLQVITTRIHRKDM